MVGIGIHLYPFQKEKNGKIQLLNLPQLIWGGWHSEIARQL